MQVMTNGSVPQLTITSVYEWQRSDGSATWMKRSETSELTFRPSITPLVLAHGWSALTGALGKSDEQPSTAPTPGEVE